jgi:hypothetical protein
MPRFTQALAAAAIAGLASLTACSSSPSASTASSGTSKSTTHSSGSAGGSTESSSLDAHLPTSTNICSMLPAATVAGVTGTAFSKGAPQSTPSYEIYACNYTSAKFDQLDVSVLGLDASPGYDNDLQTYTTTGHKPKTIAGLGDKAFYTSIAGTIGQVDVLYGDVLITFSGWTSLTVSQARTLAADVHGKLG